MLAWLLLRAARPPRIRCRGPYSPLLPITFSWGLWGPWGVWDRNDPSGIGRRPEVASLPVGMGPSGPGAGPAPIHRPRGGDLVRRGDGMISDLRTLGASWTFHCDLSDRGRLIVSLRRPLPAGLPADRPDRIARNGPVQDRPGGRPQSVPRFAMRPDPWPPPVRLVLIAHPVRPRSHPGGPTPAVRSGQGRPTPARARPTVWPGAVGGSSYHEIRRPTEVPADPYRPDGG